MAILAPARCPGCSAPVAYTLAADPDVPVYACHSTPHRIVCVIPQRDEVDENVTIPSQDELGELVRLGIRPALDQWIRVDLAPTLGICDGCDTTTVDGWCPICTGRKVV